MVYGADYTPVFMWFDTLSLFIEWLLSLFDNGGRVLAANQDIQSFTDTCSGFTWSSYITMSNILSPNTAIKSQLIATVELIQLL